MKLPKILLLACAVVVCFILVTSLRDTEKSARGPATVSDTEHQPKTAATPLSSAPREIPPKSDGVANPARELLAKYNAARSYREFLYSAKNVPEQGGTFYALHILFECSRFSKLAAGTSDAVERGRAIELLNSRCDMSAAERDDYIRELNASRDLNSRRDPFLRATSQLLTSTTPAERAAISGELLAWADPFSIAMIQAREGSNGSGELDQSFLSGKLYSNVDGGPLELAWQLAYCELGRDCGPNSTSTLKLCATRGWCAASTYDAIQKGYQATDGSTFANILSLRDAIVAAIRRKDVGAFIGSGGNTSARR